ncbi:MAG: hypothetical protein IKT86_01105 [Bacteroidaceae bacterium]|nr:hypothetical protein [Bacteroidaceae bacterium]
MKCSFGISLLLGCAIWLTACTGPVILGEPDDTPTHTGQSGTTSDNIPSQDSVAIVHEGTYASPYSIAEAQTLGRGKEVWIEGYIVGCVKGSMKNGCNYTQKATTASNILLADTFPSGNENDYLRCMPVELPNNSAERDELNLYDTPQNYHRKVLILGNITLYYDVPGIRNIADYIFTDTTDSPDYPDSPDSPEIPDNPDDSDTPNIPSDPDATRNDTVSITEAITLQNKGKQPYIKGYIVGYYNGSSICFNPSEEQISTRARNNIVLADNTQETNEIIIVELPAETTLRQRINLTDNPQNLHRMLTVKGVLRDYKDTYYAGCMETLSGLRDDEDYYFLIE